MRGHGLTVVFCLVVIGFFALVAAEHYSWTSREAYVQVRTVELAIVILGFVIYCLVAAIYELIDWCQMKLDQIRRRKRP